MKHETFETQVILKIKTLSSSSSSFVLTLLHRVHFYQIGWLYLIPTVISVTAAMLSKEQGITICGICAIYEIFVAQKVSICIHFSMLKCYWNGMYNIESTQIFLYFYFHFMHAASHERHKAFNTECSEWKSSIASDKLVAKWSNSPPDRSLSVNPCTSFCSSPHYGLNIASLYKVSTKQTL